MAVDTSSVLTARQRRSTALSVNRGHARTRTVRLTSILEPVLEGIALSAEVLEAAALIQTAAATSAPVVVIEEAGRLGRKAQDYLAEFRRFAAALDQ